MEELNSAIREILQQYWGFDTLRPLQERAIQAGIEGRDSLVVMPTGGGKSLCYQVPPMVTDRIDVVISPLISLMKDQVDGLRSNGYPAVALHSGLSMAERNAAMEELRAGTVRLLFVSPERLANYNFRALLVALEVASFAIDEAHCISHWGHDFRPEYRQIATLREAFPAASLHGFTATATPQVRADIVQQLQLRDPEVIVGSFDRPNLTYRVRPRTDRTAQVTNILRRHKDEASIVYCMTRRDTEQLAKSLKGSGIDARAYHAGLAQKVRARVQEDFAEERLDVVVATVAFGMGIDRSDVRCVIHAAMPKSVEHYQQETGRAGRDGLEAECVLLYSAADPEKWLGILKRAVDEGNSTEAHLAAQEKLIRQLQSVCSSAECRHKSLMRYFGEIDERESCGACDVCLGEITSMPGATTIARKVLSAVARLDQRYGVGYVVQVLRGASTDGLRRAGHDGLSVWGLLRDLPDKVLTNLVYQLIEQDLLVRTSGDRPVVRLTESSMAVLRGDREVRLIEPRGTRLRRAKAEKENWEGVDRGLVEHLRDLRRRISQDENIPAYLVLSDRTLRDMARLMPGDLSAMHSVHGIGERKLADYGELFLDALIGYASEHGLAVQDSERPHVEIEIRNVNADEPADAG